MATTKVQLRSIAGTEAVAGWAAAHTLVVDRPDGKAGGNDLGFTGGQLLALAIGGCLCNDIHAVAHDLGIAVRHIEVDVELTLEGESPMVAGTQVFVTIAAAASGATIEELYRKAVAGSAVGNSVQRGFPVKFALMADALGEG